MRKIKKYLLEKSKKYYEDNKENINERMKEYNKIYWLENKEKILELRRTKYNNKFKNYYLSNKYYLLEKSREYYINNKKYKLENTKENYYLKNYDIQPRKKGMIITKDITLYFN